MSGTAALDIADLRYAYPDGASALHGVSLRVAVGERVALVGGNGAGKSTLLLHCNGLLCGEGRVAVEGIAIDSAALPEIRRRVGLLFQDPDDQLFCPTVADDAAFGPRQQRLPADEVERRVAEALAAVGLADLRRRHPHHLSLGQKKRAAIAAVLACRPSLLALDEPTSGLDPAARRELIALLSGLACTQLIATHDLPLVRQLCGRVVVMAGGRVLAEGEPQVLLEDAALLAAARLS